MTSAGHGHLAMLAFSALVAGSFSLGSMTANHVSPVAFNAVRFVLAGLLVGAIAVATTGIPRSAARSPWRYLILGGLFAIYFVLMFEGLKTAAPVSAAAMFTLTPVMAAGFGWILLRQVTNQHTAVSLALGCVGALWVVFRADWQAFAAFQIGKGELIYFGGCIAHAIYAPMIPRLNRGEAPIVFTFGTLVAGGVLLLVWGWRDVVETNWQDLPSIVWITLAYVVCFATAASFICLQFASLRLPSSKVMAYTYLTPTWVIGWEFALGHGLPGIWVLAGIAITVLAMALLLDRKGEERATSH